MSEEKKGIFTRCPLCKRIMNKTFARARYEDTHVGYYCKDCGILITVDKVPVIPVSWIAHLTPGLDEFPPDEVFKVILEIVRNPDEHLRGQKEGEQPEKKIMREFVPFCRNSERDPKRLDRESFKRKLREDFMKTGAQGISE